MTTDIREGLALALVNSDRARRNWPAARWKDFDESTQRDYLANADCALAFIRAHDGHAEFVRAVRAAADVMEDGWLIRIYNIRALGDAQLEKEPSK